MMTFSDLTATLSEEPLSLTAETFPLIQDHMLKLLDACCAFKSGDPFSLPPTKIDKQGLLEAAEIADEGESLSTIIDTFKNHVLPGSLNFGSPTFLAHPDCGNSVAAILGAFAGALMQQNLSSFDYSPAASSLELQLLRVIRQRVGFPLRAGEGTLSGGGAFVFGGAGANFACLLAAREKLRERLRQEGRTFDPRRTRVLANRPFSHFSLRRSLFMLGLGNRDLNDEQCEEIGVDRECLKDVESLRFRMDINDLSRQIEDTLARGEQIMCIFATAGDSRMMAFDDIQSVVAIAKEYGIWVHVDACEGGQVLFSPERRKLMAGVEEVNSISMDPHKVLMIPYNLSLFMLREVEDLLHVSGGAATVINQDDRTLGTYTPVINSKGFISLKLWFMLKHWGWTRLAEEIERRHALAKETAEFVRLHPKLRLVNSEVQHNAVAFLYCPTEMRQSHPLKQINLLNQEIHQRLNMETKWFVHSFPSQDDEKVVSAQREMIYPLRMMFGNPLTTWQVVRSCLERLVSIGDELSAVLERDAR